MYLYALRCDACSKLILEPDDSNIQNADAGTESDSWYSKEILMKRATAFIHLPGSF